MSSSYFYVMYLCAFLCVGEATFMSFRARKNYSLSTNRIDKSTITKTLAMCVNLCELETSFLCQTISWNGKTCLLSKKDRLFEYFWPDSEKYPTWITACRILYAVFMATGVDGEHYTLTFEDAKTRCEASGSSVASREDLLEARQMGLDWCECGWLSDGTAGFVLQSENLACSSVWKDSVMKCKTSDYYNVWCKSFI